MNCKKQILGYALGVSVLCASLMTCGTNKLRAKRHHEQADRYVVVLSLDGFRWDYQTKTETPHLDAMDREGISGHFRPCFPSLTFPNHYAMVTGLYPNNHGLVANEFWDEEGRHYKLGMRTAVENPIFYLGEPIWNTARRQGLRSASYFWVGSETAIGGHHPHIWKSYDKSVAYRDRADSVLSWLQLPEEKRPRLIMWYIDEPDHTGHHHSPEAKETERMIRQVDSIVGYFREGLGRLTIAPQVDFILVSDHGMMNFKRSIDLAAYIRPEEVEHVAPGPFTHIYPKAGYTEKLLVRLRDSLGLNAMRREDLPERFHYGSSPRIGEIVVLASREQTILYRQGNKGKAALAAGHGFDNEYSEMQAVFKAVGQSFDKGKHFEKPIPNITLYPLICQLLGIEPAQHDADEALARKLHK